MLDPSFHLDQSDFLADLSRRLAVIEDSYAAQQRRTLEAQLTPSGMGSRVGAGDNPEATAGVGAYAPATVIADAVVGTAQVIDGSITAPKVVAGAIEAQHVSAGTIQTQHFAVGATIADVRNSDGNVVIDSSGETIENGVLVFKDTYGALVLDGAGFGEAWEDFIRTGLYNGVFGRSDATADTSDHWTKTNGTVALDCVTDSSMPGAFAWQYAASAVSSVDSTLNSDYTPITPGYYYQAGALLYWTYTSGSPTVQVAAQLLWYDKDQAYLSATAQTFYSFTSTIGTGWYSLVAKVRPAKPPNNAHYAVLLLTYKCTATGTANLRTGAGFCQFLGDPSGFIPDGTIVLWSGAITAIPEGWALCNGTNGTPDLTDRFIVGLASGSPSSGGTASPASAIPNHATHSTHGTHSSAGSHDHGDGTITTSDRSDDTLVESGTLNKTIASLGHTHEVTVIDDGGHTHDAHDAHSAHDGHDVQKYYKLAYIMKV